MIMDPSSSLRYGKPSVTLFALLLVFPLVSTPRLMVMWSGPGSGSSTLVCQLAWIEYTHNPLCSAATGMPTFVFSLGNLPLCFPSRRKTSLSHAFKLTSIITARFGGMPALLYSADHNSRLADWHQSPAPNNQSCQKVWLSLNDISLKTNSKNLSPLYLGP